ncbi:MAG: leucyl/phenylalanyl-tRNA--protein transferase, partial [Pseudomonadota bacterium]
FGESMFSVERDASKIALVYLVARLRMGGFTLLDTQFVTDHLLSLGAQEISRSAYHTRLAAALQRAADYWAMPRDLEPDQILQAITHTS